MFESREIRGGERTYKIEKLEDRELVKNSGNYRVGLSEEEEASWLN